MAVTKVHGKKVSLLPSTATGSLGEAGDESSEDESESLKVAEVLGGGGAQAKKECTPRDSFNQVYVCMVLAGAGVLLPWSAYVGAFDYFFYYYSSEFPTISVVIPMTNLACSCLAASMNLVLVKIIDVHTKITFGYITFVLSLLSVLVLDIALHNCAISTSKGFYITIFTVAFLGLGSGSKKTESFRSMLFKSCS